MGKALVVGEIALCLLALGGGGLLMAGLRELQDPDAGFRKEGILTAQVTLPEPGGEDESGSIEDQEELRLLLDRLLDEVRNLPGVRSASWASAPPLGLLAVTDTFRVPSTPVEENRISPRATVIRASPGYEETLGVGVLEGRFFESGDLSNAAPVAVVSRSLALAHFGLGSPVGQPIQIQGATHRIVGVLAEVRQEIFRVDGASEPGCIYLPLSQGPLGTQTLLVRTEGDPELLADPVRAAFQEVDPDVALSQVVTLEELLDQFYVGIRVFNAILSGFGAMALLLAALGVYGMLAYSVSRRRREIGLRMAVGAKRHRVVGMVLGEGLKLAAVGILLGGLLTFPVAVLLRSLFQGVSDLEWTPLLFFGSVLLATTVLASASSASGAAKVDPVRTLAGE
jgi:putative ABC transport system permease protein